jgi:hypothetical protein
MKKSFLLPFLLFAALCVAIVSSTPTNKAMAKANKTAVDNSHVQFSNLQNADCPSACASTCHSTAAPPILLQNTTANITPAGKDEHSIRTANKSKYGDDDEQAAIITATSFIGAVTIPKAMPDIPINIATLNTNNTLGDTGKEVTAWNTDGKLPAAGINTSGSAHCQEGHT